MQKLINRLNRLEILEKKMLVSDEDLPGCIIIQAESARLDGEEDTSEIVQFSSNEITYYREPAESEEDFTTRAAMAAKGLLPSKNAIPVLLAAVTERMLTESSSGCLLD